MTKIEWAEAVWNPTIGCTIVDHRCTHCYAMRDAYRKQFNPNAKIRAAYEGTVRMANGFPVWTGRVNLLLDRLEVPLRRRKPTTYFVDSMSDLFHPNVPDDFIDRVFAVMALCPQHRFIVLTKRVERMATCINADMPQRVAELAMLYRFTRNFDSDYEFDARDADLEHWPLPNVILGASASDQATLDSAATHLLRPPAACRVLSIEPLLGPVDLDTIPGAALAAIEGKESGGAMGIHWLIVGGESGPGARPMHPDWARSVRDQCRAAGVPFFFKQWGEYGPPYYKCDVCGENSDFSEYCFECGGELSEQCGSKIGKKAAGRLLDGREWNELPEVLRDR